MDNSRTSRNRRTRHVTTVAFILVVTAILLVMWGLDAPARIPAALVNNFWSLDFIKRASPSPTSLAELPPPPPSHAHANLWLAHQALKSDNEDRALTLLQPLIEDVDPLALDTQAKILFNQGQYEEAVDIWQSTSNTRSLEQARGAFIGLDLPDFIYRADSIFYTLRPEEYAAWYAGSLADNHKIDEAVSVLESTIETYPNSDQKSIWLRVMGDIYRDQQKWTEAETVYLKANSVIPTDPKAGEHLYLMLRQKP